MECRSSRGRLDKWRCRYSDTCPCARGLYELTFLSAIEYQERLNRLPQLRAEFKPVALSWGHGSVAAKPQYRIPARPLATTRRPLFRGSG